MYKEKEGKELIKEAEDLGLYIQDIYNDQTGNYNQPDLQRRVREGKRAQRESSLWKIALISASVSLISAIAAWFAVLK